MQYWRNVCSDLECLDEKFGPATFFLTLSCAEYCWGELNDFLKAMNSDIERENIISVNEFCSVDPVMFAFFFEKKWKSFLKNIILNKNGPLGEVTQYFWRIEYQGRGKI